MKKPQQTYYLFLDLETIGLNYKKEKYNFNTILELAYILTDDKLNTIAENSYVIKQDIDELWTHINDNILRLHTNNNLLDDVKCSKLSMTDVETLVVSEVNKLPKNSRVILAGSTVHFDKEVLRRDMPNLYNMLHYRNLDVSSVREALQLVNKKFTDNQQKIKTYKHRAKDDIKETLVELKNYIKLFNRI